MGALMNTRGLTEIIVLQVAYDAGILTRPIFVAFLVMALVTTALTSPLLQLVDRAVPRRAVRLARPAPASRGAL